MRAIRYNTFDIDSTILTIADWYHNVSSKVTLPSVADSTLINGLGRYKGGPKSELSVVSVTKGKRYRIRLIAMVCGPFYTFSIDGHELKVIEADGVNTEPYCVNNITIFPAQRYSFVLHADQPVGNYWIRAEPRPGGDGGIAGFEGGINSGILRYHGAPVAEPKTKIWSGSQVKPLKEAKIVPLENPAAPGKHHPGGADVNMNLHLGFNNNAGEFTINNASWAPPSVPILLQILNGHTKAQDILPHGSVYTLPPNKVIEVSIPPGDAGGDPVSILSCKFIRDFINRRLCAHSMLSTCMGFVFSLNVPSYMSNNLLCLQHDFSVVRSAGSSTYNYANPVRRDTVSTGTPGDNVTIRFETDNTGPWLLHWFVFQVIVICRLTTNYGDYAVTSTSISTCKSYIWRYIYDLILFCRGLAIVFAENPRGTSAVDKPTRK